MKLFVLATAKIGILIDSASVLDCFSYLCAQFLRIIAK